MTTSEHGTINSLAQLLPHRPPMLLLDEILSVTASSSRASVRISENSPFYLIGQGVPSWTAIEILGQTAALIAGHQRNTGVLEEGTGFLLGCRTFTATEPYLPAGTIVYAQCEQTALVEGGLATFACTLSDDNNRDLVAATLSVFRQPVEPTADGPEQ